MVIKSPPKRMSYLKFNTALLPYWKAKAGVINVGMLFVQLTIYALQRYVKEQHLGIRNM